MGDGMLLVARIFTVFVFVLLLFAVFIACLLSYWCIGDAVIQGGGQKWGWAIASVGGVIVAVGIAIAGVSKLAHIFASNPFQ